jgi:hypothetical protein
LNGLSQPAGASDAFQANRPVMIWSLGPDAWTDVNVKANRDSNKDNVLSW